MMRTSGQILPESVLDLLLSTAFLSLVTCRVFKELVLDQAPSHPCAGGKEGDILIHSCMCVFDIL